MECDAVARRAPRCFGNGPPVAIRRRGQAGEDAFAVVMDFAGLAVKKFWRANDLPAERRANSLMAETDAQNWKFTSQLLHEIHGDTRFLRCTRAGRDDDRFRFALGNMFNGNFVVAMNLDGATKLAKVLREVVGE